jgi:hypothetical protein
VQLFLDAGFSTETTNETGQTPAMIAAFHGNPDTLKLLIEKGAKVKAQDKHGLSTKKYSSFIMENIQQNPFGLLPKLLIAAARAHDKDPFKQCQEMLETAGA